MTDDERLQVQQPQCHQKHDRNQDLEQRARERIAKHDQDCQAKEREIRGGPECSEWYWTEVRVLAAQNFRAAGDYRAPQVLSGQVLHREIDRIAKPNE